MCYKELSASILRELLDYDPNTGKLFWKERDKKWFKDGYRAAEGNAKAWNKKFAGKRAFSATSHGYKVGRIFGIGYRANRVIWAYQTGKWPEYHIDHINGDREDDRWENLREATISQNNRNKKAVEGLTSPHLGVHWQINRGKWISQITHEGVTKHLGTFDNEFEAAEVYKKAATAIHEEFASYRLKEVL